ncbi:MAG TPA: SIMPL domain-containing protein [Candidatus Paceibacterota bacterium]
MQHDNLKKYFWFLLDVFLAVVIIGGVFFGIPAVSKFVSSVPSTRTITVSGEGKVAAIPDVAVTSFSVVSRGKDPAVLADDNNTKINKVIDFVKQQGMDKKDIQTTNYNLSPDYEWSEPLRRSVLNGYVLTQTITLKMKDFSKISAIMAGLTPLGINDISSLSFQVDDKEKASAEAREKAFTDAKAKAGAMAKSAGIKLGRVVSVSENNSYPDYYGGYAMKEMSAVGGAAPVAAPILEPGSQEIRVNVSMTYELN